MAKRKDPLVEALAQGRSYTFQVPQGGDLASMRAALTHGQTLTLSPVADVRQVQPGDIVLVRWRGGNTILHLVQEVQGERFLIANSVGKINGWVDGNDVLGKVTRIVDPPPRPSLPDMLDRLRAAYGRLVARAGAGEDDARRLLAVVDDLHWYAARLGAGRWDVLPRQNRWSFESHVWHLLMEAEEASDADAARAVSYYADHGKQHLGEVAEMLILIGGGSER